MISTTENKWTTVTNWAFLAGTWTVSEKDLRYDGQDVTTTEVYGHALSGERFKDGVIRAQMWFKGEQTGHCLKDGIAGGILLGYHPEKGYLVAGLGYSNAAYAIWEYVPGEGMFTRARGGLIRNLQYSVDYSLEVTQKGQRIGLVVNEVPVIEHLLSSPPPGNQLGLFAMSPSPVVFRDVQVQRRRPTAFIAMQFGEPYDTIYSTVIKPESEALGFEVERIDEVNRPGIIFQDIQQRIGDAKVVIAEITAPNQNVYYEVGYAHALNKPTILLAQRGRDLPFDIRSYRVIFYDDSIGGKPAVERTLRQHLHSILNEV